MKFSGAKSYLILENDCEDYDRSSNMHMRTKKNEKWALRVLMEEEQDEKFGCVYN